MTFSSRIDRLMLGETGLEGVRFAPVLHARWTTQTNADGSGLTPLPVDRASTPASVSESGDTRFSIDDSVLDPAGLQLALSVRDPGAGGSAGALFRSGLVSALPASLPGNPAGFISIAFPDPTAIPLSTANGAIAANFAGGPATTSVPGVTVTGATLALNPATPGTWLLTAAGAYTGSIPVPGLATLFYSYSADFSLVPVQDPFDAAHIVSVVLGAPTISFTDAPGGGAVVTLADTFVAGFLNLISPVIANLVVGEVEAAVGSVIEADVRGRVARALNVPNNADGTPGPLPSGVTVSAQTLTIAGGILTANATAGAFGPLRQASSSSGSGCSLLIAGMLLAGAAAGALWSLG